MTASASLSRALPQYTVGHKIGSGGMGVVYEGMHRTLGRQVAIKQLPTHAIGDPKVNARFDQEARVLASLDHPHIVPVYDYVRTGEDSLLVMEKLDGGTVYSRFHGLGLTGEQSCAIALAMLAGLHAAHVAGVLHLDVKPKNLLFTSAGTVKVADFGIAQVISEGATLVTHAGEVLGTPAYIAPEQAMGNALTPAADVYAAGTVLYELLSGDLPYDNTRGALSMMRQRMFSDPRPLEGVAEPLATVVMRSLARDPLARYRDAEAFALDLGAAASAVFGSGWLERSGVPVHLAPRVLGGITQPLSKPAGAPTMPVTRVRGTVPDPTRSIGDLRDLRPASQLLRTAPPPLIPGVAAAVALLLVVLLPVLAPRTLSHADEGLGIKINDVSPNSVVLVDLTKPLVVSGNTAPPGPVRARVNAAGIPLGELKIDKVKPNRDGSFRAELPPDALMRWLVGGAATGEVQVGDGPIQRFTIVTSQHPMASAMGAGSLLLALFALAYLESLLRWLRRGHRRPATPFVAVPLGALLGAAVWIFLSALTTREPFLAVGLGCAIAGAAGACCLAVATAWTAQRRRAAR